MMKKEVFVVLLVLFSIGIVSADFWPKNYDVGSLLAGSHNLTINQGYYNSSTSEFEVDNTYKGQKYCDGGWTWAFSDYLDVVAYFNVSDWPDVINFSFSANSNNDFKAIDFSDCYQGGCNYCPSEAYMRVYFLDEDDNIVKFRLYGASPNPAQAYQLPGYWCDVGLDVSGNVEYLALERDNMDNYVCKINITDSNLRQTIKKIKVELKLITDDIQDNGVYGFNPELGGFLIPLNEENCSDGLDNDGDTYEDCRDPDCNGYIFPSPVDPSLCDPALNYYDPGEYWNGTSWADQMFYCSPWNGQGYCCPQGSNWNGTACEGASLPVPVENCNNGVDDDGDGYVDCADTDCALVGELNLFSSSATDIDCDFSFQNLSYCLSHPNDCIDTNSEMYYCSDLSYSDSGANYSSWGFGFCCPTNNYVFVNDSTLTWTISCVANPAFNLCGNDNIDDFFGEVCDVGLDINDPSDDLLNGTTCQYFGHDGGTLKCANDCLSFDTSGCYDVVDTPSVGPNEFLTYSGSCVDDGDGDEYGTVEWIKYNVSGVQLENGTTVCYLDVEEIPWFGNLSGILLVLILVGFYLSKTFKYRKN